MLKERYNIDCVKGAREHIDDQSIDLIITDPPFAINTTNNHGTYNRKSENVIEGYVEIPSEEYPAFYNRWTKEAHRILKKTGSMYIVSGWNHLEVVLKSLRFAGFRTINHIIWKYQFGVVTKLKYVTSHYHILYVCRNDSTGYTFNRNSRYQDSEKTENGDSARYADMEDVWIIPRIYRPGVKKNRNQLPDALLRKMLSYSSNPGDLIVDMFAGSFSTCRVAEEMGRRSIGFEINPNMFTEI